ncbi:NIPSNAP family protein [Peristeroidobacter soli]|uniref:NIPSNAP family protein n=1 Tax=Peristeroidobacter soli TaxID=2497877 RepID=UPI00101E0244|nr:NIPSNAP family protein [Peristeroidobacter soli]
MIVEQRTYTIQVGKMNIYRDYYAEHGLPAQKRILGKFLGFFVADIGELNQAIQLWGFDSYAERERLRAVLAADPDWQAYLKSSPQVILRQENRILVPASFSPIS